MLTLEELGQIDLLFGDETGFNLQPNIPYAWLPIGKQTCIPSEKKRVGNVFGLLSVKGHGHMHWTKKNIDSKFIIRQLEQLSNTINKPTVIVLDNASWHVSKLVKAEIDQWQNKNLYIFYLPTYSPHLNLIEILWKKIKYEWLKPKDFDSALSLKNAVLDIFRNYGKLFNINFSKNFLFKS